MLAVRSDDPCGAVQVRPAPKSEEGRALRQLFDQYGADKVLTYPKYLVNGVGDMLGDSGKLRAQLSMAMDSGMGRLYLAQLPAGKPDAAFRGRVQELLTGNAGLSPAAAGRMMQLFDEMIGWETVPSAEDMMESTEENRSESPFTLSSTSAWEWPASPKISLATDKIRFMTTPMRL